MINRTHSFIAACALAAFMLVASSDILQAGVPWGGCPKTTICNTSRWTMTLKLITSGNPIPVAALVPNQCTTFVSAGVTSIDFVVSAAGILYPVLPPPPVQPCNCPPGTWSVCCVTLPPQNWCFDICFDPVGCVINITDAACPKDSCRP